jgi:SAM-dependent methyltransferase
MVTDNAHTESDTYYWQKQNCPICELPPSKFVGKRGGRAHRENLGVEAEIWMCGQCGLLFPNPMPIPVGGLAQHYNEDPDEYFAAHDQSGKFENAARMVEKAEELLGYRGRLLDVGVGRGEILTAAKKNGWKIEGIEPSETFADRAEKNIGAKIWRTSVEEVVLPPKFYDCIMLAAVLEHLYDPDLIIKKLSASLKKGGLLYVDVPNEHGLYFKAGNVYQGLKGRDWCVNLAPTFSPYHLFGFGPKSLKMLLAKHGFKPKVWTVVPGTSLVPARGGLLGKLESLGAKTVTSLSRFGELGTYLETWAVKL